MQTQKKRATIGIMATAIVAVTAGSALAETFKVIDARATNVTFVNPANLKKTGAKAEAQITAILEQPTKTGMIAQELAATVDCEDGTVQFTKSTTLDASHKALEQKAVTDPAAKPAAGTMGANLVAYVCTGKSPAEGQSYDSFDKAMAQTKIVLANYRTVVEARRAQQAAPPAAAPAAAPAAK